MDFDEGLHTEIIGELIEAAQIVVAENADDEQDGIGSRHTRFVDLIFMIEKVFT